MEFNWCFYQMEDFYQYAEFRCYDKYLKEF